MKTRTANVCMLRVLERVAERFAAEGLDLLVLKGAALNLTLHHDAGLRPMGDVDLMVRPDQVESAVATLESLGCRPGRPQVRADFFPRFYYEREFVYGQTFPVVLDVHVRPFRPLRYARRIPSDAFWSSATSVQVGRGQVLVPAAEDMLIHLAVHAAVHGYERDMWLTDMRAWVDGYAAAIDWDRFLSHVDEWGLALPVGDALDRTEAACGACVPDEVRTALAARDAGWRDRLCLRQAPRDAGHPAAHIVTDALCTPGVGFVLAYLRAVLMPDRTHMGTWYDRRHWGWLSCAYGLRLLSPVLRRWPALWRSLFKIEVRDGPLAGVGVFAARVLAAGERIGSQSHPGEPSKLDSVRHSCRPNTRFDGGCLHAIRAIDVDEELTVDRGPQACSCRRDEQLPQVQARPA